MPFLYISSRYVLGPSRMTGNFGQYGKDNLNSQDFGIKQLNFTKIVWNMHKHGLLMSKSRYTVP